MPLSEFKERNSHYSMNAEFHGVNKKGKPTVRYVPVTEPFCSDTDEGEQLLERVAKRPYERSDAHGPFVTCALAYATDQYQVAGMPMESITYSFRNQQLTGIQLVFYAKAYKTLLTAFTEKYGKPARTEKTEFQNGFGAVWTGDVTYWAIGESKINLYEGSGAGPAQDETRNGPTGFALIYTPLPEASPATPKDF